MLEDDDAVNSLWQYGNWCHSQTSDAHSDQGTLSDISISDLVQFSSSPCAVPCVAAGDSVTGYDQDITLSSDLAQTEMKIQLVLKFDFDLVQKDETDVKCSSNQLQDASLSFSGQDFAGEFNFEIGFDTPSKLTKASTWTFSKTLQKLYADIGQRCPVYFTTHCDVPAGTSIRCTAVYASSSHQSDVVMRCPNHATVDVRGGDSSAPLNHFVRCDHREAQYVEDPFTGRHSVVVPYEPRGRDRRVDETALGDRSNTLDKSIKRSRSGADSVDTSAAVSKARKHDDDDRVYTLQIRGKRNFEILSELKEALEIKSSFKRQDKPPAQRRTCIKSEPEFIEEQKNNPLIDLSCHDVEPGCSS